MRFLLIAVTLTAGLLTGCHTVDAPRESAQLALTELVPTGRVRETDGRWLASAWLRDSGGAPVTISGGDRLYLDVDGMTFALTDEKEVPLPAGGVFVLSSSAPA